MLGLVDSLARRLVRRSLRRGLLEGSSVWLVVGAVAWLVRLLVRPEAEKVVREDLRLGETIMVSHLAPPERVRGRKARERAARQ
jgi:hypothetical protein